MSEMRKARVKLVVPTALHSKLGREAQGEILAVEAFMRETGRVCG